LKRTDLVVVPGAAQHGSGGLLTRNLAGAEVPHLRCIATALHRARDDIVPERALSPEPGSLALSEFLRLLFLVPLGYIAAVVAAATVLVFSAYGFPQRGMAAFFIPAIVSTVFYTGGASFVPAGLAILVSELFRLRSVFYFLLVGGAVGLVSQQLALMMNLFVAFHARPVAFPAAGFVGAYVYWLIAVLPADPGLPAKPDADGAATGPRSDGEAGR
jgi:hypothetical protein